jgi:hypothetical protein
MIFQVLQTTETDIILMNGTGKCWHKLKRTANGMDKHEVGGNHPSQQLHTTQRIYVILCINWVAVSL